MFVPILILLILQSSPSFGGFKLKVKKLDCTNNKEFIEVKECFVQMLENDGCGIHLKLVFIKEVKSISINGVVSYKYSEATRPFIRLNFNLCKKVKFRTPLEEVGFNEIYMGFHAPKNKKICPIQPGQEYYSETSAITFDVTKIPQFAPTGDFMIEVLYFNEKNVTLLELKLLVSLRKI